MIINDFSIGDTVQIRPEAPYVNNDLWNPYGIDGVIVDIDKKVVFGVFVKWPSDKINRYPLHHLIKSADLEPEIYNMEII